MDTSPQHPADVPARVVVGVDGSPAARAALRAALVAAADRSARLEVLTSYAPELVWLAGSVSAPALDDVRAALRQRAEDLVTAARAELPAAAAVPVTVRLTAEPPATELVGRSAGADLVVVGNRGRGAVRSALLGSVALHTVTRAACPVLVVHAGARQAPPEERVVVGVDGSADSGAALAAAVAEAARAGAAVDVVAAFVPPGSWVDLSAVVVPTADEIRADLRARADRAVAAALRAQPAGAPVPRVDVHVVEGAAADVLVDRARSARLLVVGGRGRGAVRGLLLGSVALHCVLHAPCPVLVVHPAGRRAPAPAGSAAPAPA